MVAIAADLSCEFSCGGKAVFQYAKGAARAVIRASRANYFGASISNIRDSNTVMQASSKQ